MKYIKTYETNKSKSLPEVGDYVIMKTVSSTPIIINFFDNTVGEIVSVEPVGNEDNLMVKYTDIPDDVNRILNTFNVDKKYHIRGFMTKRIIAISKNKEELEQIILNRKFNI